MTDKERQAPKADEHRNEPARKPAEHPAKEAPVSDGDAIAEIGDATGGPA